jgi:hypothetical protein
LETIRLAAEIARHQNDSVLEVHGAPMPVGEPPVVEDLQENIEDVSMGFFDLVEENDSVGLSSHGFSQLTPFFVAHVARRGADQLRHRVGLHKFGHVEAQERALVAKERFS